MQDADRFILLASITPRTVCVAAALTVLVGVLPRLLLLGMLAHAYSLHMRLRNHSRAIAELEAGEKKSSWMCWAFPPLRACGKDRSTPDSACLDGVEDARAYLRHRRLRTNFLAILQESCTAMAKHQKHAPWFVFDACFGRKTSGRYTFGPVDAYKVRVTCTLFAIVARFDRDMETHRLCLQVLAFFKGDCMYSDLGSGSAQDRLGRCTTKCEPLKGHDPYVLDLLGYAAEGDAIFTALDTPMCNGTPKLSAHERMPSLYPAPRLPVCGRSPRLRVSPLTTSLERTPMLGWRGGVNTNSEYDPCEGRDAPDSHSVVGHDASGCTPAITPRLASPAPSLPKVSDGEPCRSHTVLSAPTPMRRGRSTAQTKE